MTKNQNKKQYDLEDRTYINLNMCFLVYILGFRFYHKWKRAGAV